MITTSKHTVYFVAFSASMLVLTALLHATSGGAESAPMDLSESLKRIAAADYLSDTIESASSIQPVRDDFLLKPEGQFLTSHCREAVPSMIKKMKAPNGIRGQYTAIVYFIVFGVCKDPSALPILGEYMESLRYTDDFKVLSGAYSYSVKSQEKNCGGYSHTHTFLYALDSLRSLGIQIPSASSCDLFAERHKIAAAARAEFAHRAGSSVKPSPKN